MLLLNLARTKFSFRGVLGIKRAFSDEVANAQNAKKQERTVFDMIIEKKIKADVLYEDERCMAFKDVNPQAPVHFLVIPKKRIATLDDCTRNDSDLLAHLLLTAQSLARSNAPDGYRLVINNGRHGAQSVYHLHVHILAGRQMTWPPG